MSILINKSTRVICQGITGRAGEFHSKNCIEYGTKLVGGVTPGKGGQTVLDRPVFDTVVEAVEKEGADATMIFVPPAFTGDAILEAADAGIKVIVAITEGVPVVDMVRVYNVLKNDFPDVHLVGPNCPGVITPGGVQDRHHARVHPHPRPRGRDQPQRHADLRGRLATHRTLDLGQSDLRRAGRRPDRRHLASSTFSKLFEADPAIPKRCMMMGEIGGTAEEEAAAYVEKHVTKPVAAFIAGRTAPPGKRMGHAGAIISGGKGTAEEKIAALEDAGIEVAQSPADMGEATQRAIKRG